MYWRSYQSIPAQIVNKGTNIYELLSARLQIVRKFIVLAYVINAGAANSEAGTKRSKKYFLARGEIENYNALIDGRNFYDQPINDLIKQYDKVRKVSTGRGDDYTTGCLSDYEYFKDNYRLIAVDLSKRKALDADQRAIQQTVLQGIA